MSHEYTIPKTQTAAIIQKVGGSLEIVKDHPVKQPEDLAPGECLVKLECSGCCHTDLHAALNDWPLTPKTPLIGGHEGVGIIVAIGEHTSGSPVKVGDRVGIKWLANSCLNCEPCRQGREQNCEEAQLSGFTVDGTFQEYAVSYVRHVTPIPKNISSQEAASALCAGMTVYRAIKYSETTQGNWLVVPGAGGGLGHLAVQYARARGLRVIAVDTGAEKKKLCMDTLKANAWIDFKETKDLVGDIKKLTDGMGAHATLVTAGTGAAYAQAIDYLRTGGKLMAVGLPGKATLDASIFFTVFKSISIIGSYVGNRQDAIEALELCANDIVKVYFVSKPLKELPSVYEGLKKGEVTGRVVLDMESK
ncbi:GroES-like protein [Pterulicium gracile]|uniref:alcohol dehydrogenase n=1 Tax=Pterulicium gracile TaxID=1884261 RepID=A0A5C3QAP9_9AGAR|nr:GroES-like protein [Pterula gracilis]